MSYFEQPEKLVSPVQRYYQWGGQDGVFTYWDKDLNDRIEVSKISFIDLLEFTTIKGYNSTLEGGFVSNEVRNTYEEALDVRVFVKDPKTQQKSQKSFAFGKYSEIKDQIKTAGGKYSKSVYGVEVLDNLELDLINIQFYGSGLSPWIEYTKTRSHDGSILTLSKNPEIKKKGATKYYEPALEVGEPNQSILDRATPLYEELKKYLTARDRQKNQIIQEVTEAEELPEVSQIGPEELNLPVMPW